MMHRTRSEQCFLVLSKYTNTFYFSSLLSPSLSWNAETIPIAASALPSLSSLMYFASDGCHLLPFPLFFYFLSFLACSFPFHLSRIMGSAVRAGMHLTASNRNSPRAGLAGMEMDTTTQKKVGSLVAQPAIKTLVHTISPLLSARRRRMSFSNWD